MINWKRKIEYSRFDSAVFSNSGKWDIRDQRVIELRDIEISFFQLIMSISKSILTRTHRFSPETAAFARSYVETVPFLLGEKDDYLSIDYERKDILRDFSKSTRHGEIAQGINYFVAKECLGAYAIYDFEYFSNSYIGLKHRCKGSTPDYILCYPSGGLGIIESKGTVSANPTEYLINGHKQCENGANYLIKSGIKMNNSYSSVVSFATTSKRMHRKTRVYIADPLYDNEYENPDWEKAFLYEYSKWFYLSGNKKLTEKLLNGERLLREDLACAGDRLGNEGRIIGDWSYGICEEKKNIIVGIRPCAEEFLINGDREILKECYVEYQEDKEYFSDGMFIMIE